MSQRAAEPVETQTDRVHRSTDDRALRAIDEEIRRSVHRYEGGGDRELARRLDELDREWSIERALEVNATSLVLLGLALTRVRGSARWLLLPLVVASFLLQHGVQGWCPPLPALRRLGFRSRREIDAEKFALKAIRGDFDRVGESHTADEALRAVR